jgi:hypothetical protein
MDLPYRAIFSSTLQVVAPSVDDLLEAKASLDTLKGLLPIDADPKNEPDLLYVAANLAVGGTINKNDDGLDHDTALATYKKFEKKQCNIEHNRQNIVGYIVRAGLSEIGTNRLITEEEAKLAGKPFNITTVAILWRVANRQLCQFIEENSNNPASPDKDALSLSFEVGFDDYKIVLLPKNSIYIADAKKIISKEEESIWDIYDAGLRTNGGSGICKGAKIARVLCGNVVPLGQGIVANPAADVKGLAPIGDKVAIEVKNEGGVAEVENPNSIDITPASDDAGAPTPMSGVGEVAANEEVVTPAEVAPVVEVAPVEVIDLPIVLPNIDELKVSLTSIIDTLNKAHLHLSKI